MKVSSSYEAQEATRQFTDAILGHLAQRKREITTSRTSTPLVFLPVIPINASELFAGTMKRTKLENGSFDIVPVAFVAG